MVYKFKKGHKIHIKKENRGKFTDYCGGEVTNECIQRGKNSSNPVIRKRATFADNARKWKHQNGGVVKAEIGTKFQSAINFIKDNKESMSTIASGILGAISSGKNNKLPNRQDYIDNYVNQGLQSIEVPGVDEIVDPAKQFNPDANESEIVTKYLKNKYRQNYLSARKQALKNQAEYDYANAAAYNNQQKQNSILGNVGSIINTGIDLYNKYSNKKNTTTTTTPTFNTASLATNTPLKFNTDFKFNLNTSYKTPTGL